MSCCSPVLCLGPRCEISELPGPRALLGSVSHAVLCLSIRCMFLDAGSLSSLVVSVPENDVFDLLGSLQGIASLSCLAFCVQGGRSLSTLGV